MTHRDATLCVRRLILIGGAVAGVSGCGPQMLTTTGPADAAPDAVQLPDASFALPTPTGGLPADAAERATPPACPGTATTAPRPCAALGVTIDSFYAGKYSCFDLGPVPGVPPQKYGGLTLTTDRCSTTLLIGGDANLATGKLYAVEVSRDPGGHISGFSGSATVHADAPYNDGGVAFAPNGALLLTRWPNNELQITRPGSNVADKVIDLELLGVAYASASLNFVPAVVTPGDLLKIVSWSGGQWYTVDLRPDGQGTYDVAMATLTSTLPGGPEGFVYVAAGSPLFDTHSLLVSEWSQPDRDLRGRPPGRSEARDPAPVHHRPAGRGGGLPRPDHRRFLLLDLGTGR